MSLLRVRCYFSSSLLSLHVGRAGGGTFSLLAQTFGLNRSHRAETFMTCQWFTFWIHTWICRKLFLHLLWSLAELQSFLCGFISWFLADNSFMFPVRKSYTGGGKENDTHVVWCPGRKKNPLNLINAHRLLEGLGIECHCLYMREKRRDVEKITTCRSTCAHTHTQNQLIIDSKFKLSLTLKPMVLRQYSLPSATAANVQNNIQPLLNQYLCQFLPERLSVFAVQL